MAGLLELTLYSRILECGKVQTSAGIEEVECIVLPEPFREWVGYRGLRVVEKTAKHSACHATHGDAYEEILVDRTRVYGALNLLLDEFGTIKRRGVRVQ